MNPTNTIAVTLLAVVSVFGQTGLAPAFAGSSWLPPAGLAPTETAQVNLVNTATESSGAPAPSCNGTVAFYNPAGTVIGAPVPFTVGAGQIVPVKLAYGAADAAGSRTVIRTQIVLTALVNTVVGSIMIPPAPACSLVYSFETYDTATGVTHVFFSGVFPTAVRSQVFVEPRR